MCSNLNMWHDTTLHFSPGVRPPSRVKTWVHQDASRQVWHPSSIVSGVWLNFSFLTPFYVSHLKRLTSQLIDRLKWPNFKIHKQTRLILMSSRWTCSFFVVHSSSTNGLSNCHRTQLPTFPQWQSVGWPVSAWKAITIATAIVSTMVMISDHRRCGLECKQKREARKM